MSVFRWMKTDWHHFAHKTVELLAINTIHIMNDAGKWTHIVMACSSVNTSHFCRSKINAFQNPFPSSSLSQCLPSLDCILATQMAVTFIYRLNENTEIVSHPTAVQRAKKSGERILWPTFSRRDYWFCATDIHDSIFSCLMIYRKHKKLVKLLSNSELFQCE